MQNGACTSDQNHLKLVYPVRSVQGNLYAAIGGGAALRQQTKKQRGACAPSAVEQRMSFELEGHLEFGLDCLTVVGNGTTGLVLEVVGADVESQTRSNRVLCTDGGVGSFKLCTAVVVLGVGLTNCNFENVADSILSAVGNCFFLSTTGELVG